MSPALISDYLSKDNCVCLKGILAAFVLVHHLYLYSGAISNPILSGSMQLMGYFAVAGFFCLSGYGLMYSSISNRTKFIRQFPKNKIFPFYLINVIWIVVYFIFKAIVCEMPSTKTLITSFIWGGTVIEYGWYIQVQLLLYIVFWFAMLLCRNTLYQIIAITFFCVFYSIVCYRTGFSSILYERMYSFVIGMMWCAYKNKIDGWLKTKWMMVFLVICISFCLTLVFQKVYIACFMDVKLLSRMLSMILFSVLAILLMMKIRIDYSWVRFLGNISLEIYLVQGLFFSLFHSGLLYIDNSYLYCICVLVSTVGLAMLIQPVHAKIYAIMRMQKMKKSNNVTQNC